MARLTLPEQAAEQAQLNARIPFAAPGTHPNGRMQTNGPNRFYGEDYITAENKVVRWMAIRKGGEWNHYFEDVGVGHGSGWGDPVTDAQIRGF